MASSLKSEWLECLAEAMQTMDAVHRAESDDAPEREKHRAYRKNLNAMQRVVDAMRPPGERRPKEFDTRIDPRTGLPRFLLK